MVRPGLEKIGLGVEADAKDDDGAEGRDVAGRLQVLPGSHLRDYPGGGGRLKACPLGRSSCPGVVHRPAPLPPPPRTRDATPSRARSMPPAAAAVEIARREALR
jgi:hypothetical protein